MIAFDCGHLAAEARYVCPHLLAAPEDDYCQRFTGHGRDYELLCHPCWSALGEAAPPLTAVCPDCFRDIEATGYWDGIVGRPQIMERRGAGTFEHTVVSILALAGGMNEPILDLQPLNDATRSQWVALTTLGRLFRLDLDSGETVLLASLPSAIPIDLAEQTRVFLDRCGELAAIVNLHGQYGVVLNLSTGVVTMTLDRGGYHNDYADFSVAFLDFAGRTLLIHGTDWNRVDISDPLTGQLLTARTYGEGQGPTSRPAHYLDYFHSALALSPTGEWVADNGWVWHPVGIVTTWNVRRWLEENAWESEDGPSKRSLCQRAYFWGGSVCWIDQHTVAVWGYGADDEWLLPAVRFFDVPSGAEVAWFPGPAKQLTYDEYLFSSSEDDGLSVWDVATGERLFSDPTLTPTHYHRGSRQFLTVLPDGTLLLSRWHTAPLESAAQ